MSFDLAAIPQIPLGHFPTPLERLERLSAFLGGPEIWIKRDDCTGLAFGGNKTRKLEYLLADAHEKQAEAVITFGAMQSNHVRQTIAACAKTNLPCHAILSDVVPHQETAYRRSGNLLLDKISTAHLHILTGDQDPKDKLKEILADLKAQSKTAYVIPAGGSSPTGVLGYLKAALEVGKQCQHLDLHFDTILHASATGGTQIGLTLGCHHISKDTSVLGVNVYAIESNAFEIKLTSLLADVADTLKLDHRPGLNFVHGYVGPGYGLPTEEMKEAVLRTFQLEGILLDPVYTGKAMAALFDLCRKGQFAATDKILFIHTGGSPGLFAYQDTLLEKAHLN